MEKIEGLNPELLRWARRTSGMSQADVAKKLNKNPELISAWESGESAPTYAQLERLAYSIFKRPVALFFFRKPPDEETPEGSFRTLPEFAVEELSPATRYHIRQARAFQLSLDELTGGNNPADKLIFRDFDLSPKDAKRSAESVRRYLGIEVNDVINARNSEAAFKIYREAIEESGVFVFKNSIKQREVSGFCLLDDDFPIIYLNNSTSFTRQSFSLLHELAHILVGTSGVTLEDDSYISVLTGSARQVEVFCNAFAAEVLVPSKDFDKRIPENPTDEVAIAALAKRYRVSREVILRRLLDRHFVGQDFYEKMADDWGKDFRRPPQKGPGGDYYSTQASYLGPRFLELAFSEWYKGRISQDQLATHLNIRPNSVQGLEDRTFRHSGAE